MTVDLGRQDGGTRSIFLVLRSGASKTEVEAVQGRAEMMGYRARIFRGEERTVVGVEGDVSSGSEARLGALPGVLDVVGGGNAEPPRTSDLRVASIQPLVSPEVLREQLPLSGVASETVDRSRDDVVRSLDGEDDRLVVVVGPCSIHDPSAALDYA
ncbi:MAG: hypothetical protein ACRDTR_16890, partial [Rubrobacter sp.]